jgi:hypothetical protein
VIETKALNEPVKTEVEVKKKSKAKVTPPV